MHVFTDADYYQQKYDRLGGNPSIETSTDDGDRFEIVVHHQLATDSSKIPDMLRKRIGDQLSLRQHETWVRATHAGQVHIDVDHAPASAELTMQLSATGGGSQVTVNFDIEVAIPLVGSRVEKAIAGPLVRHLHKDLRITNDIAADYQVPDGV